MIIYLILLLWLNTEHSICNTVFVHLSWVLWTIRLLSHIEICPDNLPVNGPFSFDSLLN